MRIKLLLIAILLAPAVALAYEPTSNYTARNIEGWKVLVNNKLLKEEKALGVKTLKLLADKLRKINAVVAESVLVELHKIPIWVEFNCKGHACMCYHPSRGWLKNNGFNPEKEKSVELSNARTFLKWTNGQPWMVMHELAHGYHHRVLGYGNPEIKAAYKRAVESKSYESVQRGNRKERAYALVNEQEYFAETTEAFFGRNDFYPFVRAELKKHDPKMHDLLAKLWKGLPRTPEQEENPK